MSDRKSVSHQLHQEIEAARVLLTNYRDVLGDDAQATADMVEGETNLHYVLNKAVGRIVEIDALAAGLDAALANLGARKQRLQEQKDNLRALLVVAMELAATKRLETPLATVSLKPVPPKVEIINEADVPSKYWKAQDPKLDKKALLDALKAKEQVPGAVLGNGGATIQITFR